MRVISGKAKGRRLLPVPGTSTRPITDRVKEALFDIIGVDVAGSSWWDLFAGTGAVGIEALSRGAEFVRFTDMSRVAIDTIKANLVATGLTAGAEARRADAFALLAAPPDRHYDYIYVAPPQYHGLWSRALRALEASTAWLGADGWVIVQVDPKEDEETSSLKFEEFDRRRYGTTLLRFFGQKSG